MSYFEKHVFFCTNQRSDGRACCADSDAEGMRAYAKEQCKSQGLTGKGKVRINNAGCLDRCDEGPVLVVYPEAIWYTYVDQDDVDEIIESHLKNGVPVDRLMLDADTKP